MTGPDGRRRIAVLGSGITGLSAAYHLARARQAGAPVEEFLIEASPRPGGVIRTERIDGFVIEGGPDSFLTEKPEAAALARELGLGPALIGSNDTERRTYILHHGRLVPLPEGLILMVPTRLWPVITSPLFPFSSKLAFVADWFSLPPSEDSKDRDESVASFVRRHFGNAVLENIADPLLAGVYGGDSESLSVRSVLPRFRQMEQKCGSLVRAGLAARKQRTQQRSAPGAGENPIPLFTTLEGGLEQMIGKLWEQIEPARVQLNQRVVALEGSGVQSKAPYKIYCKGDTAYEADAVILALPACQSARLLRPHDQKLAEFLESFSYTSAVTVSLAYDGAAIGSLPPGFGFLVPRKEKRRLLAVTFVHRKFPGRAPEGKGLLRCFLGGARDPEAVALSDEQILALVRGELSAILKLSAEPLFHRVYRWPNAMPQYTVGHEERVSRIREGLRQWPGLFLAGNAYAGIGISDSIRSGREAAERSLGH